MVWTTEKNVFEELIKREISFLYIWYVYVVAQFYPWFKGDFLLFLGISQNILPLLIKVQSYFHKYFQKLPYWDLVIKLLNSEDTYL